MTTTNGRPANAEANTTKEGPPPLRPASPFDEARKALENGTASDEQAEALEMLVNGEKVKAEAAVSKKNRKIQDEILTLQRQMQRNNLSVNKAPDASPYEITFYTPLQALERAPAEADWLVPGFLARQALTELDGKVKRSGKTTIALDMVRCLIDGTDWCGYPTVKTKIIYVTEQEPGPFNAALQRAGLANRDDDLFIVYRSDLAGIPWAETIKTVTDKAHEIGAAVLVIDTIAKLTRIRKENQGEEWVDAIDPLLDAKATNLAIFMLRHSGKEDFEAGDSGRGHSSASGDADIIFTMKRRSGNTPASHRVLSSVSRYDETPETLILDFEDRRYKNLGSETDVATGEAERIVGDIVYGAEQGITENDILDQAEISRSSAKRAIKHLHERNEIIRRGTGRRGDPFLYAPLSALWQGEAPPQE